MRLTVVLLFFAFLGISTPAFSQTFHCHVKNVPFWKVRDTIRDQTGYLLFFQSESEIMHQIVSLDVKNMTVEDFLKVYFGVTRDDFKLTGKNYFIKRRKRTPFGASLMPAPPKPLINTYGAVITRVKEDTLSTVVVSAISNGYQRIPKERATGSFGYIDRDLIMRSVSTNITDRMENTIPGLLSNHGQSSSGIPIKEIPLIHGLSTIFANPNPLIVLDNFPYDGDINNINPNDIESITALKDAAAASIWGVRAGNGVIVINTRKSKLCDTCTTRKSFRPSLLFSNSFTIQPKPNLYNVSSISSADFIDREKYLFDKGLYPSDYTVPFTPVIDQLTRSGDNTFIESMKSLDVRKDIGKYLYQTAVSQQYFLQATGSTDNAAYYASGGWDHNTYGLTGSSYDRVTLRIQNSFRLSKLLSVETGINFTHTTTRQGGNPGYNYRSPHGGKGFYPYAQLADAQGNHQSLSLDYNPSYLQATDQLHFLNHTYSPLDDLRAEDNTIRAHDLLINLGSHYIFTPSFNVELKYQYENGGANGSDLHDESSYYTRDLINNYIQVDPSTHALSYPISRGGIIDLSNQETVVRQGRLQMNLSHTWKLKDSLRPNNLTAIGGYEIKSLTSTTLFDREYGYNPEDGTFSSNIDYAATYRPYQMFTSNSIPNQLPLSKLVDHFLGYYANASFTYHRVYTLSASMRNDAANLFGVKTNQKGVPLWSTGVAWQINREHFYHLDWMPSLKLRATYGHNGNISRRASAYNTAKYSQGGFTGTPYAIGYVQGLSNPNLRWEQVGVLNLGLDFATKGKTLSGSFEYYRKKGTDLMAPAQGDPTLGLVQTPGTPGEYYGNTASMNVSGVDINLETHNLTDRSGLQWTTNFIFSRAVSKVHTYQLPVSTGSAYLDQNSINPHPGEPIYSIYSFKWKGLDPKNGDPMGYYNGVVSKDWLSIYNKTPIDSMIYNGPSQPTIFGALRNKFEWRQFTASFTISYKLGYYFRRPSISYSDLFNTWTGHGDYARRWQNMGDEARTTVPSAGDPSNINRDAFYLNSSILVEKADHIRLDDIQFSYDLEKEHHHWVPVEKIRFYTYVSNLGILWRANKSGTDPYYINIPKERPRYSVGINVNF